MPRDFFDPTPEQQDVILVDAATLHEAEKLIESCEACNREDTHFPFDNVLHTDYVMPDRPACPQCQATVTEKRSSNGRSGGVDSRSDHQMRGRTAMVEEIESLAIEAVDRLPTEMMRDLTLSIFLQGQRNAY